MVTSFRVTVPAWLILIPCLVPAVNASFVPPLIIRSLIVTFAPFCTLIMLGVSETFSAVMVLPLPLIVMSFLMVRIPCVFPLPLASTTASFTKVTTSPSSAASIAPSKVLYGVAPIKASTLSVAVSSKGAPLTVEFTIVTFLPMMPMLLSRTARLPFALPFASVFVTSPVTLLLLIIILPSELLDTLPVTVVLSTLILLPDRLITLPVTVLPSILKLVLPPSQVVS